MISFQLSVIQVLVFVPCNLFPTPNIRSDNISWLYQVLADRWIKLGLPIDTRENIERGGFYTTVVRPGLRLISFNMNYCSPENVWLFINSTDPLDQLQWMIQWLQYAEDHGEKVHVIGHIPSKHCLASFRYITLSLTTFSYLNPGYRVYPIDGNYHDSSYWVLDHHTVIMNLTATNMHNRTIFIDEYDARDAYQMENLFPNDWHNLIERLKNDIDGQLMGLVYQYYTESYADGRQCNHNCRRGFLCDFITARLEDPHACDSLPNYFVSMIDNNMKNTL
ncbi:unnamed protein product [Rotaria sp. Silwood2]|nr:unnamed protein product [Rotaria sp. Silwood2]CAF3308186.1 unnamed protein product [Rotaria sp. Silwood2]CAF4031517.1 unnamed protein product [Rotaria sp. Silwood2]